jgi:hypothetical protein
MNTLTEACVNITIEFLISHALKYLIFYQFFSKLGDFQDIMNLTFASKTGRKLYL